MSGLIWWIGAIHVVAYVIAGTVFAVSWAVWKAHSYGGYNAKILRWHYARYRWSRRDKDGLTDAEWQRGDPRP